MTEGKENVSMDSWSWLSNSPGHVIAFTFPMAFFVGQGEVGKELRYRKKICNNCRANCGVKHTSSFCHFISFLKKIDMQVQEAQSPKQDGCKETHSKTCKNKERILKASREKEKLVTYREIPIRLSADFLKQTLKARKDWQK